MPKEFSPGEAMSLVILERFGLMNREQICELFEMPQAWFVIWKLHYSEQSFFRTEYVQDLAHENHRLRGHLRLRSKRAASKRKYSEEQIDCVLRTIISGLATPEQMCDMYGISLATINRWSTRMSEPRSRDA